MERLGLNFGALLAQSNALITRPEARVALVEAKAKEETTLLARSFATRETVLKQELASLRQSEKDLSKQLHDKCQEAIELEAKILPLRIRVIELEEAAEASRDDTAMFPTRLSLGVGTQNTDRLGVFRHPGDETALPPGGPLLRCGHPARRDNGKVA